MDRYDFAAILVINGLDDGEKHKLTGAEQREMFGFAAIRGIVRINPNNQGEVVVLRYTHSCLYSYEKIAQAINEQRQVGSW
jgi:hypothetical protein